jgi:hypothetical protein
VVLLFLCFPCPLFLLFFLLSFSSAFYFCFWRCSSL